MLRWAFRIGLVALVASILFGAVIASIDPDLITDEQARVLDAIGKCLVAVWFAAGIPLWLSSVAHLWRNRQVLSPTKVAIWSFFLLTLSLLAAFAYFPRYVSVRGATS